MHFKVITLTNFLAILSDLIADKVDPLIDEHTLRGKAVNLKVKITLKNHVEQHL